ncbi:MAG: hypothetical protein SV765_17850 [Pseudomonadota bacterium]|nr:hypothetical protein [Pseudomonadota bacterium]
MTEHHQTPPDQPQDPVEALLRQSAQADSGSYDPEQSLRQVLSRARRHTATRDLMGFFVSWIWMLFAGFGASLYQAQQRRHPGPSRPPARNKPQA